MNDVLFFKIKRNLLSVATSRIYRKVCLFPENHLLSNNFHTVWTGITGPEVTVSTHIGRWRLHFFSNIFFSLKATYRMDHSQLPWFPFIFSKKKKTIRVCFRHVSYSKHLTWAVVTISLLFHKKYRVTKNWLCFQKQQHCRFDDKKGWQK